MSIPEKEAVYIKRVVYPKGTVCLKKGGILKVSIPYFRQMSSAILSPESKIFTFLFQFSPCNFFNILLPNLRYVEGSR